MILALLGIAFVMAFGWHILLKSYWGACVGATATSTVLFTAITANHFGWFNILNLVTTLVFSLAVAVPVGIVVDRFKPSSDETSNVL